MTKPPCGRSHASSRICRVSTSLPASSSLTAATVRVDCGAPLGPLRRIWTSFGYDEINWTSTPAGKRHLKTIRELRRAAVLRPLALHLQQRHRLVAAALGRRQRLSRGRRRPAVLRLHHRRPGLRRGGAGRAPAAGGAGLHAARARPRGRREALCLRAEPDPVEPVRGRAVGDAAEGLRQVGRARRAPWSTHCVERYGAEHVRGWLWELWNEPDIVYWRGTPEQFYALYDVTAAAVKAALPEAAVGARHHRRPRPGPARPRVPARLPRALRAARARRSTSSRSTPRAGASRPGGSTVRSADRRRPGNRPPASRCCARCARPSTPSARIRRSATCRASWTSATPRCPPTGACTTTPTSPTATPSTFRSSSAS